MANVARRVLESVESSGKRVRHAFVAVVVGAAAAAVGAVTVIVAVG